nr:unnamed protein product [Callosobruchus analis]
MGKRSRSSSDSSSDGVNPKRVLKELNYLKKKLKRLEKRDKYDRFVDDGGQDDRPPSVAASSKSNARPERRRHRSRRRSRSPFCHGTRHRPPTVRSLYGSAGDLGDVLVSETESYQLPPDDCVSESGFVWDDTLYVEHI